MKSYTNLEQAKKLAEFLPLESSDMWYHGHYSPWKSERKYDDRPCPFHSMRPNWDISCWSLTALMDVLDRGAVFKTPKGWACQFYIEYKAITSDYYNNPIDACFEIVLKFHELKML